MIFHRKNLSFVLALGLGAGALTAAEFTSETLVYKKVDGRDLHLTLDKPAAWKATDQRPAIVFFFGGGWVGAHPKQFQSQSEYFATRGMLGIYVEYRLIPGGDKGPPVVCCQDAKSAMRWVRAHAAELGVRSATHRRVRRLGGRPPRGVHQHGGGHR